MASGGAIKAGQAWVGLGVVDTALVKGLESAKRRVEAFGKTTASIGAKMAGAGTAILAPIAAVFKASFNRASDIKDLSDQLGIGAEKVSSYAYAFERGGVDLEGFGDVFKSLQTKMFSAADGNDELFRRLMLNARNLERLPIDKQFEIILDRVNALDDPINRATAGAEMFGSSWSKLQNTTLKSAGSLKALREEAVQVGAVITDEQATQGKQITQSLTEAWQALKYAVLEVGMALLGYSGDIASLAGNIREIAGTVRDWIKENRNLVLIIVGVGAGLVAAGAALVTFGALLTSLGTIFGVVAIAVKLLVGALGLLFSPGGLILAGIVATVALAGAFDGLGSTFSETWGGIMAAISSGDLSLALKVAGAGIEAVWATVVANLTEIWVAFKNIVVETWHFMVDHFAATGAVLRATATWITEGGDAARKQLDGEISEMQEMREQEKAERQKFRTQQVLDARQREADARAELAAIVNRAKAGKGGAGGAGEGGGEAGKELSMWDAKNNRPGRAADPMQLYMAAKGTFGTYSGDSLKQSLGYGDNIGQRLLTVNTKQLGVLGGIKEAIINKPGVVWK